VKIIETAVRRPVTTWVFVILAVVLGIYSLTQMVVELFPQIDFPRATVSTAYEETTPNEIQEYVSEKIEESVSSVEKVAKIHAISAEGFSYVIVEFDWDTDMDFANLNLREKLDRIKNFLPSDADDPVVFKFDITSFPVIKVGVSGPDLEKVKKYAEDELKPRLERLPGVAEARVTGGREREIQVNLDLARMAVYGVSTNDVTNALRKENLNRGAGTRETERTDTRVRMLSRFKSVDEIDNVVVKTVNGTPVYLREVATVNDTFKDINNLARYNRQPGVNIDIIKTSDGNIVQIADAIKERLEQDKDELADGMQTNTSQDFSAYIKGSISMVRDNAVLGSIFAAIILLIFLKNMRSTIIIIFAIPTSIVFTFFFMRLCDLTLNLITLGGLALGVGMVIDNSIVILENIVRNYTAARDKQGAPDGEGSGAAARRMNKFDLVVHASVEVGLAVLTSTFTTLAVFFPILFVVGIAGEIFEGLALAVLFALTCSLGVAFTFVPMLVAWTLVKEEGERPGIFGVLLDKLDRLIDVSFRPLTLFGRGVHAAYHSFLAGCTKNFWRGLVTVVAIVAIAVFVIVMASPKQAFFPDMDQGIFKVEIETPRGSSLAFTDAVAKKVEAWLVKKDYVRKIATTVTETNATVMITLYPKKKVELFFSTWLDEITNLSSREYEMVDDKKIPVREREKGLKEITTALRAEIEQSLRIPDTKIRIVEEEQEGGGGGGAGKGASFPVHVEIIGDDRAVLDEYALKIAALVERQKAEDALDGKKDFKEIVTNVEMGKPELRIAKDETKIVTYGLQGKDVADALEMCMAGSIAGQYRDGDDEYDITVRLAKEERRKRETLGRVLIRTPRGRQVRLSEVTTKDMERGPIWLFRRDQQNMSYVRVNCDQDKLQEVNDRVEKLIEPIKAELPEGYRIEFGGQFKEMGKAFAELGKALVFAIILVLLIMAALFESFVQPFIIMSTLFLAFAGVVLSLWISGVPMSMPANIGIIMLAGIVVNNGILLVDYINTLRKRGRGLHEAVEQGGAERMRPVMMTTLTTVLGMLPLALKLGSGTEFLYPLGVAVIGGLLFSTVFTLVFVPTLYMLIEEVRGFSGRIRESLRNRLLGEKT